MTDSILDEFDREPPEREKPISTAAAKRDEGLRQRNAKYGLTFKIPLWRQQLKGVKGRKAVDQRRRDAK